MRSVNSAVTAKMFSRDELLSLDMLRREYSILISNCHDIRLRSLLTGHEWVIVSPYSGGPCEVLHRHSDRDPFHHQKGRYPSLVAALTYIQGHDEWCNRKQKDEVDAKT